MIIIIIIIVAVPIIIIVIIIIIIIIIIIDLRSAQVYCVAIFLVSQEVSLNFHRFCG